MVVTLFCCGLRVSELCGLNWSDVDLSRGQAWILGKGKREKELIELPTPVVDAIQRYATHRGTGAVRCFRPGETAAMLVMVDSARGRFCGRCDGWAPQSVCTSGVTRFATRH